MHGKTQTYNKIQTYRDAVEYASEQFDTLGEKLNEISEHLIDGREKEALFALGSVHSICFYIKEVLEEKLEQGEQIE